MKKTLSILLIAGIWGSTQGQNTSSNSKPVAPYSRVSMQQQLKMRMHLNDAASPSHTTGTQKRSVHKIQSNEPNLPHLGSSFNPNSVRDASTTTTTANQACGLIVMTHRDDSSKFKLCNDGAYEAAFSIDGGATWDTNVYIGCNLDTRYPNGAIFNPAGNTDPNKCYMAMSGPFTNNATSSDSWVETAYGSITIGNTNKHEVLWTNGVGGAYVQNTGDLSYMSSSDDSTVHIIGEGYSSSGNNFITWLGAVLTTGKFNAAADSFEWTQKVFRPHLVPGYVGFTTTDPYDSLAGPLSTPGTAWSQDGKTGYVVIFGNLDSIGYNYSSRQPIVYKTTNSGNTWTMLPPFNFRNLTNLTQYLQPTSDSGIATPLWYLVESTQQGDQDNYDLTVDVNGNLHIFGAVIAAYYTNPDSAYITEWWRNQHGQIYDVYTTNNTGGWKARWIDSMQTYPCGVEEYSDWQDDNGGSVSFGARIQASRTTDGKHVFCTWEDDITGAEPDSLVSPDVFGQGYDVTTNSSTLVRKFTSTSNNYFLCVSDIAVTNGSPDTTYTVPCTIAFPFVSPGDGGGLASGSPINYFYLGAVQYQDTMFRYTNTGIPIVNAPGFYISPNYPNPFSNITNFNISLVAESVVKVDVYNLVGEKVYSIGSQKMSSGNHLMAINGSGLGAGVYFYTVTVNNQTKTQKMVVR